MSYTAINCAVSGPEHRAICALVAVVGFFALVMGNTTQAPAAAQPPVAITIVAQPITSFDLRDSSRRQFGGLEFRGGLVLSSSFTYFGGISAIRIAPSGTNFIALSDKGWWLRGRILYDGTRPIAIADAEMAPMLGPDGRPLAARGWYDTESIAQDGGTLYVGIERVHQIVRFNYEKEGLLAHGYPIALPSTVRSLPSNKGLEALVFVPSGQPLAGTLIAISERGLDRDGNIKAFLIGGPRPGDFAVKRIDDYDINDAALLAPGDVLILERKFNWSSGLAIRIRRIALADVRAGALVDGPALIDADLRQEIDNMEGLSIHRGAEGESILTLISDDNFSPLQRTLLLQFALTLRQSSPTRTRP
jgi:hypothetical protein